MRKHIREQIDFRIEKMDKQCYADGACKLCGCATTALQMANKACDKPCYPPMMGRKKWKQSIYRYQMRQTDNDNKQNYSRTFR